MARRRRKIPRVGDRIRFKGRNGYLEGVVEKLSSDYFSVKLDKPREPYYTGELARIINEDLWRDTVYKGASDNIEILVYVEDMEVKKDEA